MLNNHRARVLIFALLTILHCLLVWNLSTDISPVSAFQGSDTFTPTDHIPTQTPAPAGNPTDSSNLTENVPTSTFTQTAESDPSDSDPPPLPAVFKAGTYAQGELVVRFKPSTRETRIGECFQATDIQVQSEIEELNIFVLRIVSGDLANTFHHVQDCAGVLYVEPNFLLQAADTIPNDPGWGLQYGLINIRAPQGWDLATGSPAVTIAIVDSGVDHGHPELAGKLVAGYDFVNNDANPQDDNGHGTHVAGIAAASSNNGAGIAGVSWGTRVMPVKVLNSSGGGTYANTADGVVWAVDHGAQVINLSLGGTGESAVLEDAINYAHGKGAVIIAAAGNTGANFVLYPARYPNVIAVARTDGANNWNGSNFGPEVDLSAPGDSIYSTVIGGYGYRSGSSMSTGFVSGLAAILKGIPGNTSPGLIKSQLETTALDIEFAGWDDYTGAGLIQMDAAINLASQSALPTASPTHPPGNTGSTSHPVAPTHSPISLPPWTLSPTPDTQTATSTQTVEPGPTSAGTASPAAMASPTGSADEVGAQGEAERSAYLLPCAGLALIGLGLLLLLAFRRK